MEEKIDDSFWTDGSKLWEAFELVFDFNVKSKLSGYLLCDLAKLKKSKNRLLNIIALIEIIIVYIISTQHEEEFLSLFEIVGGLNSVHSDLVKDFFMEIIGVVNKPNLQESLIEQPIANNASIQEFEGKLNEYEVTITNLQTQLSESKKNNDKKNKMIEELKNQNTLLENELQKQEILLNSMNKDTTNELEEQIESLTANYNKRIQNINNKLTASNSYKDMLERQLKQLIEENKKIEKETSIKIKSLRTLPVSHVSKEVYESLRNEKNELERRLMDLENSFATELSDKDHLKDQINKLKRELESRLTEQKKTFDGVISDLNDKLVDKQKKLETALSQRTNIQSSTLQKSAKYDEYDTSNTDQAFLMSTFKFQNSEFNANDLNNKPPCITNSEVIERFDVLQRKFEEMRLNSKKENEELKIKIKSLTEELMSAKSKNNSLHTNRSNAYTSMRDLGSREMNKSKKKSLISEELVDKMMGIEKENRKLKFTNSMLQEKLIKNTGRFNEQLDILQSVVSAYVSIE